MNLAQSSIDLFSDPLVFLIVQVGALTAGAGLGKVIYGKIQGILNTDPSTFITPGVLARRLRLLKAVSRMIAPAPFMVTIFMLAFLGAYYNVCMNQNMTLSTGTLLLGAVGVLGVLLGIMLGWKSTLGIGGLMLAFPGYLFELQDFTRLSGGFVILTELLVMYGGLYYLLYQNKKQANILLWLGKAYLHAQRGAELERLLMQLKSQKCAPLAEVIWLDANFRVQSGKREEAVELLAAQAPSPKNDALLLALYVQMGDWMHVAQRVYRHTLPNGHALLLDLKVEEDDIAAYHEILRAFWLRNGVWDKVAEYVASQPREAALSFLEAFPVSSERDSLMIPLLYQEEQAEPLIELLRPYCVYEGMRKLIDLLPDQKKRTQLIAGFLASNGEYSVIPELLQGLALEEAISLLETFTPHVHRDVVLAELWIQNGQTEALLAYFKTAPPAYGIGIMHLLNPEIHRDLVLATLYCQDGRFKIGMHYLLRHPHGHPLSAPYGRLLEKCRRRLDIGGASPISRDVLDDLTSSLLETLLAETNPERLQFDGVTFKGRPAAFEGFRREMTESQNASGMIFFLLEDYLACIKAEGTRNADLANLKGLAMIRIGETTLKKNIIRGCAEVAARFSDIPHPSIKDRVAELLEQMVVKKLTQYILPLQMDAAIAFAFMIVEQLALEQKYPFVKMHDKLSALLLFRAETRFYRNDLPGSFADYDQALFYAPHKKIYENRFKKMVIQRIRQLREAEQYDQGLALIRTILSRYPFLAFLHAQQNVLKVEQKLAGDYRLADKRVCDLLESAHANDPDNREIKELYSLALSDRAVNIVSNGKTTPSLIRSSENLLRQALKIWPENDQAEKSIRALKRFAGRF